MFFELLRGFDSNLSPTDAASHVSEWREVGKAIEASSGLIQYIHICTMRNINALYVHEFLHEFFVVLITVEEQAILK